MPEPHKTKVLLVTGSLGQGGSERFTYEFCKAIDRDRFDVHLLLSTRRGAPNYYEDRIRELGITIHKRLPTYFCGARAVTGEAYRWPLVHKPMEWALRSLAARRLRKLLEEFDVIYVIEIEFYLLIQALLPNNDRVVTHLMSNAFQYPFNPYRDCRPGRKYRFVYFDPTQKDDYQPHVSDVEAIHFPLALDLRATRDLSAHARIEEPYRIGVFMRLSPQRPIVGIFQAFAKLVEHVDATLVVYGSGTTAHFDAEIDRLGIRSKIEFAGHTQSIERALIEDGLSFIWMTCHDATLGYASIELASFAFPMLFWNLGRKSFDEVQRRTGGAFHAHSEPAELAAETLDLLREPETLRTLGRQLREYVIETYEIRKHVRGLEERLEAIAREARAIA